jgi:predicted MPP superfamily phosphohydrolase
MKTVIIGDTHGRNTWKDIVAQEQADRVIFIGDYFDSFDIDPVVQQYNFKEIIEFKEKGECEVILLVGNHDFHYYPGGETYSGYRAGAAPVNRQLLKDNDHHLQMCYQLDNILFTHAGIGDNWLTHQNKYEPGVDPGTIADFVNAIWKHQPNRFMFCGIDQYGNTKTQTPIWIRPQALMAGNRDTFLKKDYIQVVGHTAVEKIDIKGKSTGGRYYFIDTLDTSSQFLVYEDGEFKVGVVENETE